MNADIAVLGILRNLQDHVACACEDLASRTGTIVLSVHAQSVGWQRQETNR